MGGVERIQLGKMLLLQDKNLLSKFKDKPLEEVQFEGKMKALSHKILFLANFRARNYQWTIFTPTVDTNFIHSIILLHCILLEMQIL